MRASSRSATAPTGRLIQEISRQEISRQETAQHGAGRGGKRPPIALTATARARWTASGYAWPMSAIVAGIITAAAAP